MNRFFTIAVGLVAFWCGIAVAGELNDYNPYDYSIPDNCNSVNSDLLLSGAPSDAKITKVKTYYEIYHSRWSDLKIWLTAYYGGGWHDFILHEQGSISGNGWLKDTKDNLTTWNGASPNQTWYLAVKDCVTGQTGYIAFFELWITYQANEPPSSPYNPNPSAGAPNVSRTTDLSWSCSDPNSDVIYYTAYFEKDDSSPDNMIKNDATGASADPGTLVYSSHYYWQIKADDHKGGVTWGPVWDFYTEAAPIVDGEITTVSFDKTQVKRGQETINATITIRNTGNQNWTFYVGGSSIKQGDVSWYDWSPSRASKTLSVGQSGTVNLSWSPSASVPIGTYGFFSKIFMYSTGDEFVDDDWREAAFSVDNPTLSLNGRIAYHSYSGYLAAPVGGADGNIFIYNLNTTDQRNLTGSHPVQNCMNPHFSPDGSKITFMAIQSGSPRAYSSLEIYLYDLAEEQLLRLTHNSIADEDPKFAPNGRTIVFKRNGQIWTMGTDGSNEQQVTTTSDEKSGPNFSPDGSKIVYWSNAGSAADIWWMSANGQNPSEIVASTGIQEYYPIFRDLDRILYTRWESISDQHDKVYQYSIGTAQNDRLQINVTGTEDSDPFPVSSTLIGFSSQRSGGKGGWDVYIGESTNSTYYSISQINSVHHDLGGTFSPYRYARKVIVVAPTDGANIIIGTTYLLTVRASSDGGTWVGANPSVTFSGPTTQTFTGLNDDGINGDQNAGDGIYSRTVTLPSTGGAYFVASNAVSSDNSLQNNIVSQNVSITLSEGTGSLQVTISPQGAIDAGAQWRRIGTFAWRNSGYTESSIPVGEATVEFKSVTGWNAPPNQGVTIDNGQTTHASGTYTQQTGSLQMMINPQGAIDAGAQWRRMGTSTWRNSSYTESSIPVGEATLEFKSVTGWNTPTNQQVTISADQTTTASGTYIRLYSISGKLYWDSSGTQAPISNAKILLSNEARAIWADTSDASGAYSFMSVLRDNYCLKAAPHSNCLYDLDTSFFDTLTDVNVTGKNIFFPSGPLGAPTDVEELESPSLPEHFLLSQNRPNPFNPSTRIEFSLPRSTYVEICIFNIEGRRIRTLVSEHLSAGYKAVSWDGVDDAGREVSSGVYFYRLVTKDFTDSKKMILLK